MKVVKRNGGSQNVDFNKITNRISILSNEISNDIDPIKIAQRVCNSIYDNVTTRELDELSADIAISLSTLHPDYGIVASRLCVNNIQKITSGDFFGGIDLLFKNQSISCAFHELCGSNREIIQSRINYANDYLFDYFGMKTLLKSYLLKIGDTLIERPQDMWMRVALGIHGDDLESAFQSYDAMSNKLFTHATPTLFNAGTNFPQLSSCYLLELEDDSIMGIYNSLKDCAQISKWAGGIGIHMHKLRASGSPVMQLKGACTGIVPALRVFNATSRYVNQGGRRPGSIAIYLSVDHADIFKLLDMRKNHGDEEERCRDLFYGVWIPDLFMERVKANGKWSLFCPHRINYILEDLYGDEYTTCFEKLEKEHMFVKQIDAQQLWFAICNAQIETGTPYILYKDHINRKSNQKNVGVIKSSNLCTEIVQFTSPEEIAVCNLASISLPMFIKKSKLDGVLVFDHEHLHRIVKMITVNLNKVIDINFYPVDKAKISNTRHRPIGIGVQGLADVYMMMRYPFDSKEASVLNMDIFETIYHAALEQSNELSIIDGPYETFEGSPISKGVFQFDMWDEHEYKCGSNRYNWETLRSQIKNKGVRNSLLVAPMPTASTSQILGNNECIEPYTSNLYLRRTLAGEFVVINKHLVKDLINLGLWNEQLKNELIYNDGSVQKIRNIPKELKNIYKTAWELKQRVLIDQAADRGMYVCQSQSMNLFVPRPDLKTLSSMHFHSWAKGLKTGMYYLRTQPASNPIQFTLNPNQSCDTCSA